MLRDVAVDVVGVLQVEEADRLLVALLGAGDGLGDDAVAVGALSSSVVLERKRPAGRVVPSSSARARNASIMRELPSVLVLYVRARHAATETEASVVALLWRGGELDAARCTYAYWLACVRLATPSLR